MTSIVDVPWRRSLSAARTAKSILRAQPFSIGTAAAVLVLGLLQHSLFGTPVDLRWQTATGPEPVAKQGQ